MFKASKRTLIAGLAVAAAAAPSTASARFILADPASGPATSQSSSAGTHAAQPAPSSGSEFDWADAGIGAAAAVGLMGAGTIALSGRKRRGHTVRAS